MSYDRESAYNYWTNLQMWRISSVFKLTDKLKLTLRYNFLRADERYLSATASYNLTTFSGAGKTRGHLPQLKMEYSLNKNISTYFQAEYFVPGDFYVKSADDALFLRAELQVKF
jgi:predicted porin